MDTTKNQTHQNIEGVKPEDPKVIVEAHIVESTQDISFEPDYVVVDGVKHPYSYLYGLMSIEDGLL